MLYSSRHFANILHMPCYRYVVEKKTTQIYERKGNGIVNTVFYLYAEASDNLCVACYRFSAICAVKINAWINYFKLILIEQSNKYWRFIRKQSDKNMTGGHFYVWTLWVTRSTEWHGTKYLTKSSTYGFKLTNSNHYYVAFPNDHKS